MSEKRKIIGVTVKTPLSPSKLANNIANEVVDFIKSKTEQEKTVEITENGTVEILPDEGYMLSKVTANVNVSASGGNKLNQYFTKTITEVTAEDLEGLTSIDSSMSLSGNTKLINVTIPNSVTNIGSNTFSGCTNLTSITIGDGVTSIGDRAFQNCRNLTSVHITDIAKWCAIQIYTYSDYSHPLYYAHNLYLNENLITNLEIPNGVTEIKAVAFRYCTSFTSVTIPNSVTSIGGNAFSNCTNLTSIRIGNGISSIANYAFSLSSKLTDIYIDKAEGEVTGAPWGATNATIHWNTPLPSEEV